MDDNNRKQIEEVSPLVKFSLYTATQAQSLRAVGEEINGLLKDRTDTNADYQRAYDLFWLWVLGAYEIVRTMHQHKECFAAPVQIKIGDQKNVLANIRMPFAKQEMRGSGDPVYNELSVVGYEDGMLFDSSKGQYNSTTVVEGFLMFLGNIKSQDIISSLPVRGHEQL